MFLFFFVKQKTAYVMSISGWSSDLCSSDLLKTESGNSVLRRRLATADVVTENYRRGALERLGLGYDELKKENPALILAELSGFGRTGPYADRGGFDLIAQSMSGLMSVTGEGPGRPPMKCGVPLTDITAGILAAMGVLAAYVHRLKTGEGQERKSTRLNSSH